MAKNKNSVPMNLLRSLSLSGFVGFMKKDLSYVLLSLTLITHTISQKLQISS